MLTVLFVLFAIIAKLTATRPSDTLSNVPTQDNGVIPIPTNGVVKLVREKRFLNGIVGSAFPSLQSGNWQECGRTRWGATIYTNGIGIACFGNCPEHVRCGYRNNFDGFGSDRYGYQGRVNFGQINIG